MASAHVGRSVEPLYRPILSGGRGDLEALGHLDSAAAARVVPILEPATADWADLLHRLPAGLVPALDLSGLPDDGGAAGLLRRGVPVLPVIGFTERDERLAAQGAAARLHLGRAVVRLRLHTDRSGADAATGAAERIWRRTGLAPEQCDLLIDAGDVCCAADVRVAGARVRRVADWARRHAWCSVTVAAGAMPATLARFAEDEPVSLPRWDWRLWQGLTDLGVGYGDYGVRPAVPGAGRAVDRLPTVRYTAAGEWWLYRWARRGGRGDDRVADLCRAVVAAPQWPATGAGFSWGDHEILRRARGAAGGGSATNWAAWSTSHHLAHVLAALAGPEPRWGAPGSPGASRRRADRARGRPPWPARGTG